MRNCFIEFLMHEASRDQSVMLIVGDVGYSVIEPFAQAFPDRYMNAGIAEQNMIGMAAGLAMAGKRVYVYSIVPFACMRPFEQIRDDLCYQNLPVVIVGNGGGFCYAQAGVTHHAIEDVAIMRSLPGMTVVSPGSLHELRQLLPQIHKTQGPVYLRLGTTQDRAVYNHEQHVVLGSAVGLIEDDRNLVVAHGHILDRAWDVVIKLRLRGYAIGLVSLPTIKPFDRAFFNACHHLQSMVTIEEHSIIGGLADAVSAYCAQERHSFVRVLACGIPDVYAHATGSREYLCREAGLDVDHLVAKIESKIFKNCIIPPSYSYKELS